VSHVCAVPPTKYPNVGSVSEITPFSLAADADSHRTLAIAVLCHLVASVQNAEDYSKRIELHFARALHSLVHNERASHQLFAGISEHTILIELTLRACIGRLSALLPMHPPVGAFTFTRVSIVSDGDRDATENTAR
jgi:hypothetical protein